MPGYRRTSVVAWTALFFVVTVGSRDSSDGSTRNTHIDSQSSIDGADIAVGLDATGEISSAAAQLEALARASASDPEQPLPHASNTLGEGDSILPTQPPSTPEAEAARAARRPAEHPDIVKARQRAAALTAADEPDLVGECVPLERAPLPNNTIRADDVPEGFDLAAALREIDERRLREQAEAAAAAAAAAGRD